MNSGPTETVSRHTHILGTVVDIRVRGADTVACTEAERVAVDEIVRLQAVFNCFDEQSELSRWKRGEVDDATPEFAALMAAALVWQQRSDGAFNPLSGVLSERWRRAADVGTPPSPSELRELAASISAPRWSVDGDVVRSHGDCSAMNLNAIAKGHIVDRATELAALRNDIAMVLVSAGGDMAHRGAPSARVGIENPLRPYDNEPPLTIIELREGGLATSGGSRRGFQVGAAEFSHVIDPRTGQPVDLQASISVTAASAMEADVLATTLGMADPAEAIRMADRFDGCGCMVVGPDGSRSTNAVWAAHEVT